MKAFIKNGLLQAFCTKAITSLSSVVLVFLINSVYSLEDVGRYAVFQSVLLCYALIARFGINNTIMFYIGVGYGKFKASPVIYEGMKYTLSICFCLSLLLFYISTIFNFFKLNQNFVVLICLLGPILSFCYIFAGALRGLRRPSLAILMESGGVSLLMILILWLTLQSNLKLGVEELYKWALYTTVAIGLASVIYCTFVNDRLLNDKCHLNRRKFISKSSSFFIISISGFLQNSSIFLIGSYFLEVSDIGTLKLLHQLTLIFSFVLVVSNTVIPPRLAKLYSEDKLESFERLIRLGASVGFLTSVLILSFVLVFHNVIFNFLSIPINSTVIKSFLILSIAQVINVSTGCVNFALTMSGKEKVARNIVVITSTIGILIYTILISNFGLPGAMFGVAIMVILQNLLMVVYVRYRMKIRTTPSLSVINWFYNEKFKS
ncbi:hypothetical protein L4C54_18010 [Vibrio lamellibrachiae]|uniref:lipopolysaccharide biosynthesis protein n=1 Tax=Vibrio lamellibrachiae TaxID=2910253 RepID=UPI003D0A6DC3